MNVLDLLWDTFGGFEISAARARMGCVRLSLKSNQFFFSRVFGKNPRSGSLRFILVRDYPKNPRRQVLPTP